MIVFQRFENYPLICRFRKYIKFDTYNYKFLLNKTKMIYLNMSVSNHII